MLQIHNPEKIVRKNNEPYSRISCQYDECLPMNNVNFLLSLRISVHRMGSTWSKCTDLRKSQQGSSKQRRHGPLYASTIEDFVDAVRCCSFSSPTDSDPSSSRSLDSETAAGFPQPLGPPVAMILLLLLWPPLRY